MGIIFQAFNLVESLTAAENVAIPLRSAGTARAARQRAVTLLDSVGLGDCVDRRPGLLSGGEQQRVAVARALALDPPLVLADEPTAHLDQYNVEGTLRLLRRLTNDGRTVVVSTHDQRLVPLADETIDLAPRLRPTTTRPGLVELADGEVLFHQGDPPDWVYVVVSGTIELVQDDVLVASAGAGDWFGEMGPLFSLPRSATARASGPPWWSPLRRRAQVPPRDSHAAGPGHPPTMTRNSLPHGRSGRPRAQTLGPPVIASPRRLMDVNDLPNQSPAFENPAPSAAVRTESRERYGEAPPPRTQDVVKQMGSRPWLVQECQGGLSDSPGKLLHGFLGLPHVMDSPAAVGPLGPLRDITCTIVHTLWLRLGGGLVINRHGRVFVDDRGGYLPSVLLPGWWRQQSTRLPRSHQ